MKKILLLGLLLLVQNVFANILSGEMVTYWKDNLGSTMKLTSDGNGHLTGTFTTKVGCDQNMPQPLIGAYNGQAISFTVNFKNCSSLTSWVGHIDEEGNKITTVWYLSDGTKPEWASVLAGYNIFTRLPAYPPN